MLNIAIVGTGIIGLSHITAMEKSNSCRLSAICDVNEEVVKSLAKEKNVPYFLDYHDIPSSTVEVDAVILNLPHFLHCEATVFFLEHGIHVLCEKPMANTAQECDLMIQASEKSGKKLGIGHVQRFLPANQYEKSVGRRQARQALYVCRNPHHQLFRTKPPKMVFVKRNGRRWHSDELWCSRFR